MPSEIERIAALIDPLRARALRDDPAWEGSPLDWVRRLPSPRRRGAIGEALVEALLREHGIAVERAGDADADRAIGGVPTEIKTAFRCARGRYTFMQLRPSQRFERLLLLGISPDRLDLYLPPRDLAIAHARRQHLGAAGSGETLLLSIDADQPAGWITPYGGRLETALALLDAAQIGAGHEGSSAP